MKTLFKIRQLLMAAVFLTAIALSGAAPVSAEPDTPQAGGVFFVNSNDDNTNMGGWLTLREAILLANGGTGPNGLNRPIYGYEFTQIQGCTFSKPGTSEPAEITGGCGAGFSDTIVIMRTWHSQSPSQNNHVIGSALPALKDSAPTIITGEYSPFPVTLDFSKNVIAGNVIRNNGSNGVTLAVASHNNKIGGPTAGSSYGGNWVILNKGHGIHLVKISAISPDAPAGNVIVGNWIGAFNSLQTAANKGSGIVLDGANDNMIGEPAPAPDNVIAGNEGQGIWLRGGAKGNRIVNNYVGVYGRDSLPNSKNGILGKNPPIITPSAV